MCGIAGYYRSTRFDQGHLKRMTDAIRHRGPDDEGFHLDRRTGTGLGHRRLSILDLSALGHQPMTYGDSGLWIVYNGEVYNFLELRAELTAQGRTFRTETDTEVILAAYDAWGTDAFRRFNGMWALAIYDEREGSLLLCRDRYGIKPLYYARQGEQIVFGSELKVFWAVREDAGANWDTRGMRTALHSPFQLESSGFTIVDGVRNLPPGQYLKSDRSGTVVRSWWRTLDHIAPSAATLGDQSEHFLELFRDACRLRMRSDVPIGTALSGGLDSSSIVVMLDHIARTTGLSERSSRSWRTAFVHAFPGTPLDETGYARIAADAGSVRAIMVTAGPEDVIRDLDRILFHFEGVYEGMTDSVWRIYEAQRRNGVIVSLDGHGADELLAGYPWHITGALEGYSIASTGFWRLVRQEQEMKGGPFSVRAAFVSLLRSRRKARAALGRLRRLLPVRAGRTEFLDPQAASLPCYPETGTELPRDTEPLNAVLYRDFHHRVLPRILKNFDTMSMSHGVEVRMPFMDYRLVNFIFSLPAESKVGEGYNKLVLRRAMQGLLPDAIRLRKTKIGFNSPLQQWLPTLLRPWVEETLGRPSPCDGLIDRQKLRKYYDLQVRSGTAGWEDSLHFWKYLNLLRLTQLMRGVS